MDVSTKLTMLKSMGFPMKERYERVVITPTMAKLLLEHFNNNPRGLNLAKAEEYAKEMSYGRWTSEESATFIRFNEDLDMKDGQHRIKAITIANMPIVMMVAWNCSHEENMDIGMKRSEMMFYKDGADWITTDIKAMAKQKLTLDKGTMAYGQSDANVGLSRSVIKNEILDKKSLYEEAKSVVRELIKSSKGYHKIQSGLYGGIYVHLIDNGYPKETVEKFFERIKNWRTDKDAEKILKAIKEDGTRNKVMAWVPLWGKTNGMSTKKSNKLERFTDVQNSNSLMLAMSAADET